VHHFRQVVAACCCLRSLASLRCGVMKKDLQASEPILYLFFLLFFFKSRLSSKHMVCCSINRAYSWGHGSVR
jgi:hypothetical protein